MQAASQTSLRQPRQDRLLGQKPGPLLSLQPTNIASKTAAARSRCTTPSARIRCAAPGRSTASVTMLQRNTVESVTQVQVNARIDSDRVHATRP